jgi:hypothetical protein
MGKMSPSVFWLLVTDGFSFTETNHLDKVLDGLVGPQD